MNQIVKVAMKGRFLVVYIRASTREQLGTLKQQESALIEILKKEYKIPASRIKVFAEQVSGTKRLPERPELQKAIEFAVSKGAGKSAIVVRDTQRISRDPWIVGRIYDPLRELDIPLIALANGGNVASTDKTPQVNGDLLMPIYTAIGGQEISIGKERTAGGVKAARAKGIFAGTPLSLYPKDALNPWLELDRFLPSLLAKDISNAEVSRRLGKSTSWTRKSTERLTNLKAGLSGTKYQQWLDVVDMIRNMEIENGEGFGKGATKAMRAVRRMTSGYIDSPMNFPAPTEEDLQEYFVNWREYQPKRPK